MFQTPSQRGADFLGVITDFTTRAQARFKPLHSGALTSSGGLLDGVLARLAEFQTPSQRGADFLLLFSHPHQEVTNGFQTPSQRGADFLPAATAIAEVNQFMFQTPSQRGADFLTGQPDRRRHADLVSNPFTAGR